MIILLTLMMNTRASHDHQHLLPLSAPGPPLQNLKMTIRLQLLPLFAPKAMFFQLHLLSLDVFAPMQLRRHLNVRLLLSLDVFASMQLHRNLQVRLLLASLDVFAPMQLRRHLNGVRLLLASLDDVFAPMQLHRNLQVRLLLASLDDVFAPMQLRRHLNVRLLLASLDVFAPMLLAAPLAI